MAVSCATSRRQAGRRQPQTLRHRRVDALANGCVQRLRSMSCARQAARKLRPELRREGQPAHEVPARRARRACAARSPAPARQARRQRLAGCGLQTSSWYTQPSRPRRSAARWHRSRAWCRPTALATPLRGRCQSWPTACTTPGLGFVGHHRRAVRVRLAPEGVQPGGHRSGRVRGGRGEGMRNGGVCP